MTTYQHVGLYGFSVGSLSVTRDKITWTSPTSTQTIPSSLLASTTPEFTQFGKTCYLRILTSSSVDSEEEVEGASVVYKFDGFKPSDYESLNDAFKEHFNSSAAGGGGVKMLKVSSSGASFGMHALDEERKTVEFREADLDEEENTVGSGLEMFTLPLTEVTQCLLPGSSRTEIELQFKESDDLEQGTDQLVQIRFYVPSDKEKDDKDGVTPAETLQNDISKYVTKTNSSKEVICTFSDAVGSFLTPRGKYALELSAESLRMYGNKYDYTIQYSDISRLFLLPYNSGLNCAFVIGLGKGIRQGQMKHNMIVIQVSKEVGEVEIDLTPEVIEEKYPSLSPSMSGALSNLVAKTFKVLTRKKVFVPGTSYKTAKGFQGLTCSLKASDGILYCLEKQFIFIHKPTVLVRYEEVAAVEFMRIDNSGIGASSRNFDFVVSLKSSDDHGNKGVKEYSFSGIDKIELKGLLEFVRLKNIRVKNLKSTVSVVENGGSSASARSRVNMDERDSGDEGGKAVKAGSEEDSEEDEDYTGKNSDSEDMSGSGSDSDSSDSDGSGSGSGDDSSDDDAGDGIGVIKSKKSMKRKQKLEEEGGGGDGEKKKKKVSKITKSSSSSSSKFKSSSVSSSAKKTSVKRKPAKKKDPNAPKGALSAYMFFSNATRPVLKAANPDLSFSEIAGELGKSWKKCLGEDRVEFEEMAKKDKVRHETEMSTYVRPAEFDNSDNDNSPNKKAKKAPAAKKVKDKFAPKNAKGSYIFFSLAVRPMIVLENPEFKFSEIAGKLGETWKALTAEEKVQYEDLARDDKVRFSKETEVYERMKVEAAAMDSSDDDDDDSDDEGAGKKAESDGGGGSDDGKDEKAGDSDSD